MDLQNLGIKTIQKYSDNYHHIYTDGSAFKGTTKAGCGARIEYSDKNCDELCEPCGSHCDNFEAEVLAIQHSIQKLTQTFDANPNSITNCVIFSDSQSVLKTLDEQNFSTKVIRDLALCISSFIEKFNIILYLQWIPSHCGIAGNERADVLAKRGASMIQPEKCVSQATVKKILKSNKTIDWHNQWAQNDKGRVMFNFVAKPNKRDPINNLKRIEQVVIFRLRTNHIQLNAHLSRITKDHEPSCPLCDYMEETVNHFLFDCPRLQDLRKQYLPLFPNRENSLYSNTQQLKQTYRFYHEATRRRINIQV